MINNMLFAALVVLCVTEVMFIIGFFTMMGKIEDLKVDYEFFHSVLKTNNEMMETLCGKADEEAETFEHVYELVDILGDQYKAILNAHNEVNSNFRKLLESWESVAEDYESSYNQFRLCTEELKTFRHILEPWCIDSDDLGQRIVDWQKENSIDNSENPFLEKEVG